MRSANTFVVVVLALCLAVVFTLSWFSYEIVTVWLDESGRAGGAVRLLVPKWAW